MEISSYSQVMPPRWIPFLLAASCLGAASAPEAEARRAEAALGALHPDWTAYIARVRPAAADPGNAYFALVRAGGSDPRLEANAPSPGRARRFDLLQFPAAAGLGEEWSRLLLDHEYFHARHLARGDRLPAPGFGHAAADRHFQEALAWGYNLERLGSGAYGELPAARRAEAESCYREHREAFRRFVLRRDPAAWAYYGRLLPARD